MPPARLASTSSWRRWLWLRPEAWAVFACVAAWAVLTGWWFLGGTHAEHATAGWPGAPDAVHGLVMSIAMMTPLVLGQLRHAAQSSLWTRRHRAMVLVWSAYIIVWTVVAIALVAATRYGANRVGFAVTLWAASLLAVAALLSPRRRRRLRACTYTCPLPARGRRADAGCVVYGAKTARQCLISCWAPMLFATAAGSVPSMAVIASLAVVERTRPRSRSDARSWFVLAIFVVLGAELLASSGPGHAMLTSGPP